MKTRLFAIAALVIVLLLAACATPSPTFTPVPIPSRTFKFATATLSIKGEITVLAAASLTDAFQEIADAFQTEYPNTKIFFKFAAPGKLVTIIGQGQRTDVYASNSADQFKAEVDKGDIDGNGTPFARDRLVVIAPSSGGKVTALKDLAAPGINLAIAGPLDPLREYTMTLWDNLAKQQVYGPSFKDGVLKNANSQGDDSRKVLDKILQAEADAGVVFVSDVAAPDVSANVFQVLIPDDENVSAVYTIGIPKESNNRDLAQAFIDYVLSQSGQDILRKWAFLPPAPN